MTDKQLQKLSRRQLLEILVEQGRKIEELESQLQQLQKQLDDRTIKIENAGSIAQAALALTDIFEKAQEAADLYLANDKLGNLPDLNTQSETPAGDSVTARQICEMIKDFDEQ